MILCFNVIDYIDSIYLFMTIQKVAKEAGVSVATVSRTFNYPDQVSQTTRLRVQEAAARLHYFPNASARNLRTQHTRTIGVVLPTLINPVFSECLQGIAEMAAEQGYSIMPFTTSYTQEAEQEAVRQLIHFGVDGMILVVADPNHSSALEILSRSNIPYVLTYNWSENHPCISVNNQQAFTEIVHHLAQLGHQNIAMVSGLRSASDRAQQRYQGFLTGIAENNLALLPIIEVPFIDHAIDAIAVELKKAKAITALVCSNDLMAIRAIRAASLCQMQVPSDISITGFDGIRLAQDLNPSLTTVAQPNTEIGRRSVEVLTTHLRHGSTPTSAASILLNHQLQLAESSASPRSLHHTS